jgi:hypothetical protein
MTKLINNILDSAIEYKEKESRCLIVDWDDYGLSAMAMKGKGNACDRNQNTF